jgi:hypothetical protein
VITVPAGILAAASLMSSLGGAASVARCRRARRAFEVREVERQAAARQAEFARTTAWQTTKAAAAAARADDCPRVRELDAQVRALDRDLHDTVFVHDVAIARCLAAPPP